MYSGPKWEYCEAVLSGNLVDLMNQMGQDGWEVCFPTQQAEVEQADGKKIQGMGFLFRRPRRLIEAPDRASLRLEQ